VPRDLTYYAPWSKQAAVHKDFGCSTKLVSRGAIVSGEDVLEGPGFVKVTIRFAR
jgi:hypothetical protein